MRQPDVVARLRLRVAERLHVVARGRRPGSADRRARRAGRSRRSPPRRPCRSRRRSRTASCRRRGAWSDRPCPPRACLAVELLVVDLADVADERGRPGTVGVGPDGLATHLDAGELGVVLADVELEVLFGQVGDERDEVERAPARVVVALLDRLDLGGEAELGERVGERPGTPVFLARSEIGLSGLAVQAEHEADPVVDDHACRCGRGCGPGGPPRGSSGGARPGPSPGTGPARSPAGTTGARRDSRTARDRRFRRWSAGCGRCRVQPSMTPTMADERSSGPSAHRQTLSISGDRRPPMTAITPTIRQRCGFERVCSPNISPPTA